MTLRTDPAAGWALSSTWTEQSITWVGQVDGHGDELLNSPDEVLAWLRLTSTKLFRNPGDLSDPYFTGDRGKAARLVASQGGSPQLSVGDVLIKAEARRG